MKRIIFVSLLYAEYLIEKIFPFSLYFSFSQTAWELPKKINRQLAQELSAPLQYRMKFWNDRSRSRFRRGNCDKSLPTRLLGGCTAFGSETRQARMVFANSN